MFAIVMSDFHGPFHSVFLFIRQYATAQNKNPKTVLLQYCATGEAGQKRWKGILTGVEGGGHDRQKVSHGGDDADFSCATNLLRKWAHFPSTNATSQMKRTMAIHEPHPTKLWLWAWRVLPRNRLKTNLAATFE